MNSVEGTVALAGGGHLWFWDTGGDDPAIVLLHAATGSALNWKFQKDALAGAGYRVIGYSRRGHHRASPLDPESTTPGIDDLNVLVDHLGLTTFHLVGVAAGGFIATDYALSYPHRLRALVATCSMMGLAEPDWRARVTALHPPRFRDLPMDFVEVGPSYRLENPEGLSEWHALHELAHDGGPELIQPLRNQITWQTLAELPTPVLLIAGGADLIVPTPGMREIAAHIPGAEFASIPDAGHSAPWERPAEFNTLLLDFLGRVEAGRRRLDGSEGGS